MKIKLAILEKDQSYLNRIVTAFSTKYADKFEIYSFTEQNIAMSTLDSARIDVLIASDVFDIDVSELPNRCGFAYLVDSADIDTVKEQRTICKFQKADMIYKKLLGIYSEKAGSVSGLKVGDDSARIIAFCSVGSGNGASSMAAAASVHYAAQNKKTLYLNLEQFGSSDIFFSGEGQYDMSDIIFALKSKKSNLSLKLESCVKQDSRGVYFYSQSKIALDMQELTVDDITSMLSEINLTGSYDYIVIDMEFSLDADKLAVLQQAHSIVWISDGSEISNEKLVRAYNALLAVEQNKEAPLSERICLIYNKFSNKSSRMVEDIDIRNIGGAPRYEHASVEQVVGQLSKMEMFDKIV